MKVAEGGHDDGNINIESWRLVVRYMLGVA